MLAVVSDSSPLVYLTRLDRFELLCQLYDRVFIPPAVWQEVAMEGAARPEGAKVKHTEDLFAAALRKAGEEQADPHQP
jgi:predicted nucleic acid-binding protein